ncbi:Long-chain-fatty-acid--CoA ligase [Legionella pneumophila subsp. pneumophila LPE509]|nr:Long-chain-fatty-acid--CoA ligase [Legionella pneumophila subsp. pneumophila LPE509]
MPAITIEHFFILHSTSEKISLSILFLVIMFSWIDSFVTFYIMGNN